MKKVVMVMAIVVALSVIVSMIAVAPLFAAQATKTGPTPKQVPAQKTPSASQIQRQKDVKDAAYHQPNPQFWDLAIDHCEINGLVFNPCSFHENLTFNLKLTGTCYFKVQTPIISSIAEEDATYWGKAGPGKTYTIAVAWKCGNILACPYSCQDTIWNSNTRNLPQFTWTDVQNWKRTGQSNARKIWTEQLNFIFTLPKEYPSSAKGDFYCYIDKGKNITEYSELNNDCSGVFQFVPFATTDAVKITQPPKQVPTQKTTPVKQTPMSNLKKMEMEHAKKEFWDLKIFRCFVSNIQVCSASTPNQSEGPRLNAPLTMKVHCQYYLQTPPIYSITEEDANYWGNGQNSQMHTIYFSLSNDANSSLKLEKKEVRGTKIFDYDDVKEWQSHESRNVPHVWVMPMDFSWNIPSAFNGLNTFTWDLRINYDSDDSNNKCSGKIEFF